MRPTRAAKARKATKARKPSNFIGKPVLVEWGDAWAADALGMTDFGTAVTNKPLPVKQVGFVMAYTSEGITLVREIHGELDEVDGFEGVNFRGEFFVPAVNIVRLTELR